MLAGTGEARRLAGKLAEMSNVTATASLAGVTQRPMELAIPTRHGGFGGDDRFRNFLILNDIGAVIDATHPFAAHVTNRTAKICAKANLPYVYVLRPEWRPQPGDDWHYFDQEKEVASLVKPGQTVFMATGPNGLYHYRDLQDCHVICRRIDPPLTPFPFEGGEYLLGRPPFSEQDEIETFRRVNVDWLVTKNSGGDASRSKLDAARALGIKVALMNRPAPPDATIVETEVGAIDWLKALL